MTLNDLEWLSKISNGTKHRAASLWQISFLFRFLTGNRYVSSCEKKNITRSLAIAERSRRASCHWIFRYTSITQGRSSSLKLVYHSKAWVQFPIAFHGNYGSNLYHFQDKARYWSKIAIFSYPLDSTPSLRRTRRNIAITFGVETKLEWCGYPTVETVWGYV